MIYRIGMAVRPADQEWKRTLNQLIMENQAEINKLLISYNIPILDEDQQADHGRDVVQAAMIAAAIRLALVVVIVAGAAAAAADVAEPDGYRLEDYRAPTPATLRGARVIGTDEAETIWRNHSAAFVDVLPRPPRPRNLPEGTLWHDKPRADIPGSVWLPDTGYGELRAQHGRLFRRAAWKRRPRATTPGFSCSIAWRIAGCRGTRPSARSRSAIPTVAWYREGTDGWLAAGLPLQDATPEPRPGE